ncbi:cache domain-containing sensor histidine kinase [Paenibacillus jiagnxiensis]|uniref:cache domain-containing sensor histidine kinase n=1 Tax=Paenibacillus jiagnxiensis TaxID=3228926 RepID=UPI0038D4CEB5
MILLSLPSIFLLGYISFSITKETLLDLNAKSNMGQLTTSSEVADLLFRNINNLHLSIVVNEEIRTALRASGEMLEKKVQPGSLSERTSSRLQRIISSRFTDTRFVTSICLIDLRFQTYCLGRSDDAGIYEGKEKAERIAASDWYRSAYESKGKVVFYDSDIFGTSDQSFSTVKLFRDADDPAGKAIGLIVINVSNTIFHKIFNESTNYGAYMAIDPSPGSAKVVFSNADSIALGEGDISEVLERLAGQGYLITTYRNQMADWTFVHLVQTKQLLKQSRGIGWATTALAVLIGAIALVLSYFISGSITRPLMQLKKMMMDWTKGTRSFPEHFTQDEVGMLGETFKRMAIEHEELNRRLIDSQLKEREAELRALQSQIKPHFLYNTLDSIYWMALLQNNTQIAEVAISLSESFKLSLNKGKDTIPVFKELEHIDHFLKIQNIRFNNRFRYVRMVDEPLMGMQMLKLLLQPLVENAIYHGLEPKLGEGTVCLTGYSEDDYIVFQVEDDGVGMEEIGMADQGYGLRNVRDRLALFYGEDSTLEIQSRINVGTRITLRFKPPRQT